MMKRWVGHCRSTTPCNLHSNPSALLKGTRKVVVLWLTPPRERVTAIRRNAVEHNAAPLGRVRKHSCYSLQIYSQKECEKMVGKRLKPTTKQFYRKTGVKLHKGTNVQPETGSKG
jgi:hypothetical protein